MQVRDLIYLLQKIENQDAEIQFETWLHEGDAHCQLWTETSEAGFDMVYEADEVENTVRIVIPEEFAQQIIMAWQNRKEGKSPTVHTCGEHGEQPI